MNNHRVLNKIGLFISCLILSNSSVYGQHYDLEQLGDFNLEDLMAVDVVSASSFQQKLIEAPSSVTIISQDEIRRNGYRTLAEIMNTVKGMYVQNDRNYNYT